MHGREGWMSGYYLQDIGSLDTTVSIKSLLGPTTVRCEQSIAWIGDSELTTRPVEPARTASVIVLMIGFDGLTMPDGDAEGCYECVDN